MDQGCWALTELLRRLLAVVAWLQLQGKLDKANEVQQGKSSKAESLQKKARSSGCLPA